MLPVVSRSACSFSRLSAFALIIGASAAVATPNVKVSRANAEPTEKKNDETPVSLAATVREFNARAAENAIGRDEPQLTEDEVIAALRGILREQTPMSDDVYNALQKIAVTGMLPAKGQLTFTTGWIPRREGFHFTVWWVDLTIMTGETTGYTYRLRDRKISSRPLTDAEREKLEREAER